MQCETSDMLSGIRVSDGSIRLVSAFDGQLARLIQEVIMNTDVRVGTVRE